MKRVITCSKEIEYPIIINHLRSNDLSEQFIEKEIREHFYRAQEYIKTVELSIYPISSSGKSYSSILIKSNKGYGQIQVTSGARDDMKAFTSMLEKADLRLPQWVDEHIQRTSARSQGYSIVSAMTFVRRLIEEEFGATTRYAYNDSGKLEYPIYKFFSSDFNHRYKYLEDVDARILEGVADRLAEFLTSIKSEYNLHMTAKIPLEGQIAFTNWVVTVYPDNKKFKYDKASDTYTQLS